MAKFAVERADVRASDVEYGVWIVDGAVPAQRLNGSDEGVGGGAWVRQDGRCGTGAMERRRGGLTRRRERKSVFGEIRRRGRGGRGEVMGGGGKGRRFGRGFRGGGRGAGRHRDGLGWW